jgi:hypothetical protein
MLRDEQGNLVAYHQLPYIFKSVAKPDRDGGMQDDYLPSMVPPPVVSPGTTTVPPVAGPSITSRGTTSIRRAVNTANQRPSEAHHRSSVRRPVAALQQPSQWGNAGAQPPSVGVGSRTDIQQPQPGDQSLLQKIAPIEGPTRGGLNIILIGTNLPPWPTVVYARFGSAVAATVSHIALL